ncbi:MAG TPA: enoyl-CoA hydratase [Clostridiales bacterium]|nr:enoyl-CoA hydratase [Clostridiales bacterium]
MEYIRFEKHDFAAVLTIDRQQALNALNSQVIEELDKAIDGLNFDEIRVLIVTGAGEKAFAAGADIGEMASMTREEARAFGRRGNEVFRKLETLPVPVIAAVNGYALGGGCELALACDIRIASENAVFAQPEVSLGITAGFGGTQRLPRLIGPGKAKELLYTASRIKAGEALSLGLVNAVYPREELLSQCLKLAEKIAANAPIAVRATKKAINEGIGKEMNLAIEVEAVQFAGCFETRDQLNAMTAFIEKRKAGPFMNK